MVSSNSWFIFVIGISIVVGLGPCDPLDPTYCFLPFPNDFWLRYNSSSNQTRVAFSNLTLPIDQTGKSIDPVKGGWNNLDGFSPLSPILAFWPNLTDTSISNLPRLWNIEESLSANSATVLLNVATQSKIAHWCEIDDQISILPKRTHPKALLLWPAYRLNSSARYIVAIRGLKDSSGSLVSSSPAFLALRDNITSTDPDVESRREHFEQLFSLLGNSGVRRNDLQLVWDFTVGSRESLTGRLVSMRNDALSRVGKDGPEYVITKVESNYSDIVDTKVQGTMNVPFYLNRRCAGYVDFCNDCRIVIGSNGKPVYQKMVEYTWEALIPRSLTQKGASPGRIVQYGHGLFGDKEEISYGSERKMREDANTNGWILFASDWIGLAQPDVPGVAWMIAHDLTDFAMIPDRCSQGVINALMLMRLAAGRLTTNKFFRVGDQSIIDPSKKSYMGNSQGGILGAVYMAVSTDVERGVLGVGGAPYTLMLPRSHDFSTLFDVIDSRYADSVDRIFLLSFIQLLWTRAEPSAYLHAITQNPFPETPQHHILIQYGLGDAQVSWLAGHTLARSVSAVTFESNVREGNETLFGFDFVADDQIILGRNVIVGVDYGVGIVPFINNPPNETTDTHECTRKFHATRQMQDPFFQTGKVQNFCKGPCKGTFPC